MNTDIVIRYVTPQDAEALNEVGKKIAYESTFMLRKDGEVTNTVAETKKNIEDVLAKPNKMIFVAEDKNQIVGYLTCLGGSYAMTKSTAVIVIGILQAYTGKHIGTKLFEAMENWAKLSGIHRLELKVDDGNGRGMALYKKMGFVLEGTTKDSTYVNGKYRDAYVMGKII